MLKLILFVILFSFILSAVSGIIAFFIDIVRYGSPHKRFETISSVEKYNQKLESMSASDPEAVSDPIDIDL